MRHAERDPRLGSGGRDGDYVIAQTGLGDPHGLDAQLPLSRVL